jgi:hypothetical protein
MKAAEKKIARDENDFSTDRDGWEAAVIKAATLFTVFIPGDPGVKAEFDSLRSALRALVFKTRECPELVGRPIVYAVTESGRFVLIPREDWIKRLSERGEAANQ